ncbi:MAG: hypothetical protein HY765_00935, partial [Rhodomicrobium sp.]|nr:hypothetical protein [Rhodomicrobium sp.]
FRTYPICAWSGGLGPKVQVGDKQAPEGFYTVSRGQMNPHSLFYLSFNLGFPNAYDQSNGHTGSALMVHGNCKSAGCYAMTDAYIEEIYILAREAFNAGQAKFHVQALPFRMTAENMQRHQDSPWYPFWVKLKEGYDSFEATGRPPIVKVCSKQYLVNVKFPGRASDPAPSEPCPTYAKVDPAQMPGIDGVPATVLAALTKQEAGQSHAEAPVVMAASMQPAPSAQQAAPAASADMSASAVITRPAASPTSMMASMQPASAPVSPVNSTPNVPQAAPSQPPAVRVAAGSGAQPVYYPVDSSPAAAGFTPADVPSRDVDPSALQKLNRSGKGGKLSSPLPEDSFTALGGVGQ